MEDLLNHKDKEFVDYHELKRRENQFLQRYAGRRSDDEEDSVTQEKEEKDKMLSRFDLLERERKRRLDDLRKKKLLEEDAEMAKKPKSPKYKFKEKRVPLQDREKSPVPTSSKSRKQLKEEEDLQECTFQPQTQTHRRRSASKSNTSQLDVVGRTPDELMKWGLERESKLAAKRIEHVNYEEAETHPSPKVLKKSQQLIEGKYTPIQQRIDECIMLKNKSIQNMQMQDREKCTFQPTTNTRSREILKRKGEKDEIERHIKDDLKDLIRRKAQELSKERYADGRKSRSQIERDRIRARQSELLAYQQELLKSREESPDPMTEELIKRKFRESVDRIKHTSKSKK